MKNLRLVETDLRLNIKARNENLQWFPSTQMFFPCSTRPAWFGSVLDFHFYSPTPDSLSATVGHSVLPWKHQAGSCLRTSIILFVFVGYSFPRFHMFHTTWLNLLSLSLKYQEDPPCKSNIKLCSPPHCSLATLSTLAYFIFPHSIYHHLI